MSSGHGRTRNEGSGLAYRNNTDGKWPDNWVKPRTGGEDWDVSESGEWDRIAPVKEDDRHPGLPGSPKRGVQGHRSRDAHVDNVDQSRGREREARRWWPIVTPLAAVVIGVSLLLPTVRHQWALSIFGQPARYTVLSFNKSWTLPSVARRREPITIFFTIRNQEGKSELYRYVLTESAGRFLRKVGESRRIIPGGGTWAVTTVVRPTCRRSPCQIEVSLPGHPEVIDFLVTLKAGP